MKHFITISWLLICWHLFNTFYFAQEQAAEVPRPIEIGIPIEREISAGELHRYTLKLKTGALLRFNLEQESGSLGLRIFGPDGVRIQEYYNPAKGQTDYNYSTAERPLRMFAEPATEYRIDMGASEKTRYVFRVESASDSEYKAELNKDRETINWFSKNAIPIRSLTAGSGFQDLMPLKRVLRDIRVVGLGEATHGSREFFQFKHRMLEFLVREMGFNVFAIESSSAASEKINEYVLHGKGERNEVLAGQGFWQWNTEEIADMIEWMRDYNRTAPESRKVKFYGFDFQANDPAIETVLAYLRKVAPERVESAASALRPMQMDNPERPTYVKFYTLNPEEKALVMASVNELFSHLTNNKSALVERTSLEEFEKALQHAGLLAQFTDTYTRDSYEEDVAESGVATRDRYMAENVQRILHAEGEKAKMIIWSHNGHVRTTPYLMGYYLRKAFGKNYYAFGVSLNRGSFQALEISAVDPPPVREFSFVPAYQGSVGWLLNRVGKQNFAVDLRDAPKKGVVAEWLSAPHAMRSIGNGYAPANPAGYYRRPVVLNQTFDGIIFIEKTTRARPILRKK